MSDIIIIILGGADDPLSSPSQTLNTPLTALPTPLPSDCALSVTTTWLLDRRALNGLAEMTSASSTEQQIVYDEESYYGEQATPRTEKQRVGRSEQLKSTNKVFDNMLMSTKKALEDTLTMRGLLDSALSAWRTNFKLHKALEAMMQAEKIKMFSARRPKELPWRQNVARISANNGFPSNGQRKTPGAAGSLYPSDLAMKYSFDPLVDPDLWRTHFGVHIKDACPAYNNKHLDSGDSTASPPVPPEAPLCCDEICDDAPVDDGDGDSEEDNVSLAKI